MSAAEKLSDNIYQITFEEAPLPVAIIGLDGRFQSINQKFSDVFGYNSDEILNYSIKELSHPESVAIHAEEYKKMINGGSRHSCIEKRIRNKSNKYLWIIANTHLIVNAQGEPSHFLTFFSDITSIKELEEQLRDSEMRYRSLFELAPVGIVEVDGDRRFVHANRAFEKMSGYTETELHAKTVFDLTHPDDQENTLSSSEELKDPQYVLDRLKKRLVTRNSSTVWVEETSSQLQGVDETHLVSVMVDISQILENEKKLSQAADQMSTVFESLSEGLMLFDPSGKILKTNTAASSILKRSAEQMINSRLIDNLQEPTSADGSPVRPGELPIDWTIKNLKPYHGLVLGVRRSGSHTYWLSFNTVPIFSKAEKSNKLCGVLCTFTDVTDQKSTERALQNASKLASLGEMAGGVAHEINNPLTIINGKCMLLERMVDAEQVDKEAMRREIAKITQTTDRIARIVKGLRTFSRSAERDPMERIKLAEVIESTLSLCAARFTNHGIEVRLPKDPIEVTIDCRPVALSQSIINLLNNSFDAIQNLNEKWISIDVQVGRPSKDLLQILITDSGNGIPDPVADRLMTPFFTTKEVGRGTGLGLSISKGLVEDHGGRLWYDRHSSRTRFVIEIPMTQKKVD